MKNMKRLIKFVTVSAAILVGCVVVAHGLNAQRSPAFLINDSGSGVSGDDPWSPGDLMQPEELARSLSGQQKPAMLQVGIVHLYKMSHIPGSKFAGPANEAGGMAELKKQAQGMNRNREVGCYCGCCPWAFFQAEDGIRDKLVTGVQTCALPICHPRLITPACWSVATTSSEDEPC